MSQPHADPVRHRWLALGEDALPHGQQWLTPGEAAVLSGLRYTKRRTEYLLRRLVTKQAVASVIGEAMDPALLARIEVRNAPSGAPYVIVDGVPLELGVSISDRAGWAVCVTSPTGLRRSAVTSSWWSRELPASSPTSSPPASNAWWPPVPRVTNEMRLQI